MVKQNGIAPDRTAVVLAVHAERLHEDRVWNRVRRIAGWMQRRGLCATFFTYPFRAQVAGRAISDRVQEIATRGHEIAQHTHFYAGAATEKPFRRDDLGEDNVVGCLRRDSASLTQMGCRPRGFTAGAWRVNEGVYRALIELGFAYDCSSRLYTGQTPAAELDRVWLREPELRQMRSGSVLCLPSTCSLGEWFKWARKLRTEGPLPYQLVYFHDYDLLKPHVYPLAWLFVRLNLARSIALGDMTERLLHAYARA
jgi:hypothetical protein